MKKQEVGLPKGTIRKAIALKLRQDGEKMANQLALQVGPRFRELYAGNSSVGIGDVLSQVVDHMWRRPDLDIGA